MDIPFLDLSRQYRRIRGEVCNAIGDVLARGQYILGDELATFEREFAAYCEARHAVGVGSGTDAIHLALRACGVRRGDHVITAPNTATPTVCGIVQAGALPVFVDIDPMTFTLDPAKLRAYLARQSAPFRTRAIVPVHLYGHPAHIREIRSIAGEYDLKVIEDAAQAHGATYQGRRIGGMADASCWSFYPTKNLGAYGDAGMVVTDDPQVAKRLRMLRNYGEEAKYDNRVEGVNSRLDEIQAAILRVKLRHLDEWVTARRSLAAQYDTLLAGAPVTRPTEMEPARHSYHLYVIRSDHRNALHRHLHEQGIGTAIHYPTPVHRQPAYCHLGYADGDLPCAESACRQVLSLPLYPDLTQDEVWQVVVAVKRFRD